MEYAKVIIKIRICRFLILASAQTCLICPEQVAVEIKAFTLYVTM